MIQVHSKDKEQHLAAMIQVHSKDKEQHLAAVIQGTTSCCNDTRNILLQ